ncbi:Ferric reductase like transmembrane component [Ceratobasidium sp. AG-Ba]|nr:Ferric reductase like transmembrane component [Ceratobasidium sp. AG-Ba]
MAAGPATKGTPAPLSNVEIAFYTDVLILFVLLFFTLTALPRIIVRLTHTSAWRDGWIILRGSPAASSSLYSTRINASAFEVSRKPTLRRALSEKKLGLGSTESETWESSFGPYDGAPKSMSKPHMASHLRHARGEPVHLPTRCPSYLSLLQPVSKLFSARYSGYSVGQFVLLLGYAALMCVAMFLYSSPVNNITRAGYICISQIPVVFALGTKNSLIGWFVGMGYEKLNYIHRWVGQLMFITGLFHVVGYLVKWTKTGVLTIASKNQFWGWMAFGGLVFCAILSLPAIRRSSYQVFWHSHWIGLIIMVFAACLHVPACIPYCIAAGSIYGLDQLMRLGKSHFVTATITPVPEMKCTQISIPTLTHGWRAGQHVRVRVLSMGVGPIGWAECHPFTIASVSNKAGTGDGLTLLCKRAGDWTNKLYALSQGPGDEKGGYGAGKNVKVVVEGPYGGTGPVILASFHSAVIVTGGSGVTFATSSVEEMIVQAENGCARTRNIELIWVVQEHNSAAPLLPVFAALLSRASSVHTLSMRVTIHYTRASTTLPSNLSSLVQDSLTFAAGRPNVASVVDDVVRKTAMQGTAGGVVVGVCGPQALVEDVWKAERAVGGEMRKACGGVEVHEEAFGW